MNVFTKSRSSSLAKATFVFVLKLLTDFRLRCHQGCPQATGERVRKREPTRAPPSEPPPKRSVKASTLYRRATKQVRQHALTEQQMAN